MKNITIDKLILLGFKEDSSNDYGQYFTPPVALRYFDFRLLQGEVIVSFEDCNSKEVFAFRSRCLKSFSKFIKLLYPALTNKEMADLLK